MTTAILISDSSRARLFSTNKRQDVWSLAKEFDHPEGRQTSSEISPSSPPGRSQQSTAHGARHTAFEPHTTPKEAEVERFAQHLADYLEKAVGRGEFDSLVLVAPPHLLGTLRGALGQQAARHVRATVNKDLNMFAAAELRERLIDTVFPPAAD